MEDNGRVQGISWSVVWWAAELASNRGLGSSRTMPHAPTDPHYVKPGRHGNAGRILPRGVNPRKMVKVSQGTRRPGPQGAWETRNRGQSSKP